MDQEDDDEKQSEEPSKERKAAAEEVERATRELQALRLERQKNRLRITQLIGEKYIQDRPEDLPKPRWGELIRLCDSQIIALRMVEAERKHFQEAGMAEIPEFHLVELAIEQAIQEGSWEGHGKHLQERSNLRWWRFGLFLSGIAMYFFGGLSLTHIIPANIMAEIIENGDYAVIFIFGAIMPGMMLFNIYGLARVLRIRMPWLTRRPWFQAQDVVFHFGGLIMATYMHFAYLTTTGGWPH